MCPVVRWEPNPGTFWILVITDPYSHMVWLETIITKSAEEVYDKFVNRFLLEEGCPKVILTDNGREFSNKLLRELMRLCRIRLKYTPPYHPRGNYTERANRFVGESLRAMVNSPSGKKQDWYLSWSSLCSLRIGGCSFRALT